VTVQIRLPGRDEPLAIPEPGWAASYPPPAARRVFAAAHVAARVAAGVASGVAAGVAAGPSGSGDAVIDWESTIGFRDHLWAHGFGVAEAMDTSQRGMGLSWDQARELIARSAARAAERVAAGSAAALACGASTDQLTDGESYRLTEITGAYTEQLAFVQSAGAQVILMASRALAASARGARDYLEVYGELLKQAERPVILHWLGEAFDPALRGYWGSTDFDAAADTVAELIERAGDQVDGVKLSVLDAGREVALRRRLPAGVRLYTGDDFNYAELIRGDAAGHSDALHSDALLGAFAAITAPAAAALQALDRGDLAGYDAAMGPTVPLSRCIFEPPTYHYKVGVAFLAWLNGLQPQFAMLDGLQRRRPAEHLIRVLELAAAARALTDPELAAERMNELLATLGPERA
jgi:subtilisin family serine protease